MSLRKFAFIPSLVVSMAYAQAAFGQTTTPKPSSADTPCRVAPEEPQTDGSLTETLNDCNGVLKPPAVGDPGIVEEAPDVGKMPVIPPSALPEQQSQGPADSDATDSSELVEHIASAKSSTRWGASDRR